MIKFQKKTVLLFISFLFLVIFTRFYNLAGTARFTQDESSDLARMNEYYQNKQISLVGPISSDRSKVFSSLGYYMLMPFTVVFNFTPVSPVYGMAFLGTLTAVFMLLIARSVNKKQTILAGILITICFPLVLVSRWAWNPHFVIFWASFALLIYQYRARIGSWAYPLMGLFLGFMFHHHYLALLTTAPFLLFISIPLLKKKKFKAVILLALGYLLPHLIFLLFDLKNPPGLFFGKYLTGGNTPHIEKQLTSLAVWNNLTRNVLVYLEAFIENSFLKIVFGFSMLSLIIVELKNNFYRTITWVIPSVTIIFGGIFLNNFQIRYVFSSTTFVFVWLLFPRKEKLSKFLANFCIVLLLIGSLLSIKSQLTVADVTPNMRIFTKASYIIIDTIAENKLNNSNVAALSSSDDAPLAERYRDYIRMKNTGLRAESEYDVSEHLFIISTANDEILRADKSYAMVPFKDKVLRKVFDIEDTEWKVFWYGTE